MSHTTWSRRDFLGAVGLGASATLAPGLLHAGPQAATLFRDVQLLDGTGVPGVHTDVLVRGRRVEHVGRLASRPARGTRVIAGGGRVLAPGFIDTHVHGDPLEDSYDGFLAMGVTTIVLGQDGSSPTLPGDGDAGLPAWLDAVQQARLGPNVATLSGHGSLRRQAGIADQTRVPSAGEIERLQARLEADLQAGSFGLSTGLEYVPGIYAQTAELAALGPVVARHDAVAMSHMRSEDDDRVRQSIQEHIAASRPARTHVSHLKVMYAKGEERAEALLQFLHGQRGRGVELTADAYPYTAGFTGIAILFPEWALPPTDYAQVLASRRDELKAHLEARMARRGGPEALLIGTGEHSGRTLAQAAAAAGLAYADLLIAMGPRGASGAHFTMDEALQSRLLLDPFVCLCSDGGPRMRHPRSTGTFARWIQKYVVEESRLSLQEAVRKATTLPASILRLPDRGRVASGAVADLVLFDPARVRARSDYVDPFAHAIGFDLVMVNGVVAYQEGERVGNPGRLLRRGAA